MLKKNNQAVFGLLRSKKTAVVIALMVFFAASAVIFAKYLHSSDSIEDIYIPEYYDFPVIEASDARDENGFVKKSNVRISPSEEIKYPVYVRVAIVPSWQNDNGDIFGQQPEKNIDYTVSYNTDSWFLWTDGYYYCRNAVKGGTETPALIRQDQSISQIKSSPDPDYSMKIEFYTETIQAAGSTRMVGDTPGIPAYLDAWGVNPTVH